MATIVSAQNGDWNATATWVGGVVPVSNDAVTVSHIVTITAGYATAALGIVTITNSAAAHLILAATSRLNFFNVGYYVSVAGKNSSLTLNGTCLINGGYLYDFGGKVTCNGSADNLIEITGGTYGIRTGTYDIKYSYRWLYIHNTVNKNIYVQYAALFLRDSRLYVSTLSDILDCRNFTQLENCIVCGGQIGCRQGFGRSVLKLCNCVLGYKADGTVSANSVADIFGNWDVSATNVILGSVTPMGAKGLDDCARQFENYGHIERVSVLANFPINLIGDIGNSKQWLPYGTVTNGTNLVPRSTCSATNIFRSITQHNGAPMTPRIRVSDGDTIALSMTVTLNGSQTANSVALVLDPLNVAGMRTASVQATPQGTSTTLTVSATASLDQTASIAFGVEVNAYASGGQIDITACSVTINGDETRSLDLRNNQWIFKNCPSITISHVSPSITIGIS